MSQNLIGWIPLALFIVSIIFTTISGNNKSLYLVLFLGIISVIISITFIIIGIVSKNFILNLKNTLIPALPFILLVTIFVLAHYDLVDPQKIIGFR